GSQRGLGGAPAERRASAHRMNELPPNPIYVEMSSLPPRDKDDNASFRCHPERSEASTHCCAFQ
ncbi:MAG: hypothetical protein ACREMZ_15120, partial [Gemmatimonadales bacterium]